MTPNQLSSVRERSHATARKRVAAEVGEIIMDRETLHEIFNSVDAFEAYAKQIREAESARERDWVACYVGHYFRAFAYYCAFELSGADAEFARECLRDVDICKEIEHRAAVAVGALAHEKTQVSPAMHLLRL